MIQKVFFASRHQDLARIENALRAAAELLRRFSRADIAIAFKDGGDPVTQADWAVNDLLGKMLPRDGEGWLSEESRDDGRRLNKQRVWVVDPLDSTKEFVQGIPEWCVSIGLVEDGIAVAGGVANPTSGEIILGSVETGLITKPISIPAGKKAGNREILVLASRSEHEKGQWDRYRGECFRILPTGSIAGRLARVAAGLADATWTLGPRHEWDVAGGVALIRAVGGRVEIAPDTEPVFNQSSTRLKRLAAFGPNCVDVLAQLRNSAWSLGSSAAQAKAGR
jgi:myo-inositol-1(or 4)-monophosphatase